MGRKEPLKVDIVVVGAGVIGLAVARLLSSKYQVIVLEKNEKWGQETSSRNSEVIHSGIHYPKEFKKTEWSIHGRHLLYSFCRKFNVPYLKTGKYLVATALQDRIYLEKLRAHSDTLAIPCEQVSGSDLSRKEPLIDALEALYFSESGIIDSHEFMARLEQVAISAGTIFAYRSLVTKITQSNSNWAVEYSQPSGESETIICGSIVNCAGLGAIDVYKMAFQATNYEERFCRGRYFNLGSKFKDKFQSLVYPVPSQEGLGIHVTRDLSGMVRLGPDVDWCSSSDYQQVNRWYQCEWDLIRSKFVDAIRRYCPSIQYDDLAPGVVGIRPKLFIDGVPHNDFLLENREGFISLLGIESPGLTASLAIAEAVNYLV
jgi:L-2-hydroxyglutarate oxidase LhgO